MDEGCMDKGIDGTGYWIAAAGLQLCLQMAGIGEADGGIGDRALLCFRADLFLDDVKMWCLISEFMRFETGYCTRVIILILERFYVSRFTFFFFFFYDWNHARPRLTIIDPCLSLCAVFDLYLILVLIQN